MTRIVRIEITQVDLSPKVKRTDAIQSFVTQETPMVRIICDDGAEGTGYTYTIGTGGSSVVALLRDHLCPRLLGRDAAEVEMIWKDLFFHTHATAVGAITSLALAAIDTALWDLRCRRAGLPIHVMAGGAQRQVPVYTTEGGWLHLEPQALVDQTLQAKADGFRGAKIKVGRAHVSEDVARLSAVRSAVGGGFEIMVDANQAFTVGEAIRRARHYTGPRSRLVRGAVARRGHRRPRAASRSTTLPIAVGESLYHPSHFREYLQRGACTIVQADVARIGGITPWLKGRAPGRNLQHADLPALPDGTACGTVRRGAQCGVGRIHSATRRHHDLADCHPRRPCHPVGRAWAGHCVGLEGHTGQGGGGIGGG